MQFSLSSILAGLLFGVFGWFIFGQGRREANFRRVLIGLALMVYGYFVPNPWLNWLTGLALLGINYYSPWVHGG